MPTKQRIELLSLSGQLLTAAPGALYLNGVAVGGGGTDGVALSGALTQTGVTLGAKVDLVSGVVIRRPETITFSSGPVTWAAMPNAATFFAGSFAYVTYLDLSQFTGVNLSVNRTATAGTASGALYLGYLGNPASTAASYLNLDTVATRIRLGTTNTVVTSGFQPIVAAARSGVYVALLGSSGNAALGPTFGMITVQFQ